MMPPFRRPSRLSPACLLLSFVFLVSLRSTKKPWLSVSALLHKFIPQQNSMYPVTCRTVALSPSAWFSWSLMLVSKLVTLTCQQKDSRQGMRSALALSRPCGCCGLRQPPSSSIVRCQASPRLQGARRRQPAPLASLPVPPPARADDSGEGETKFERRQQQKEEALGLERGAFGGGDAGSRDAGPPRSGEHGEQEGNPDERGEIVQRISQGPGSFQSADRPVFGDYPGP
jgi:hypothetical protein